MLDMQCNEVIEVIEMNKKGYHRGQEISNIALRPNENDGNNGK